MRVSFVNRAGGAVDPGSFRPFLGRLAAFLDPPPGDLTVLFCDDREIAALNRAWRRKTGPTDVLSFPGGGPPAGGRVHLGDIAISAETAGRAARRGRRHPREEIETLLAHGVLHLLGFDHEIDDGTMMRLQTLALRFARSKGKRGPRGPAATARKGGYLHRVAADDAHSEAAKPAGGRGR